MGRCSGGSKYGLEGQENPKIRFTLHERADHLHISIANNGVGFPVSALEGNYGYGISMVDALVGQFGGSIHMYNEDGAHIDITIPSAALSQSA